MVEEAVHRGNMMKNSPELHSKEREKVANTALYVLLQKAVFPGCPVANGGKLLKDIVSESGILLTANRKKSFC